MKSPGGSCSDEGAWNALIWEQSEAPEQQHIFGNKIADEWAKKAAVKGQASVADTLCLAQSRIAFKRFLTHVSRQFMQWPSIVAANICSQEPLSQACLATLSLVHDFVFSQELRVWVCARCFVCTKSNKRLSALKGRTCHPCTSRDLQLCLAATNLGHTLCRTFLSCDLAKVRPMYACSKCGAHATRQFRSLSQPCLGRTGSNSHARIFKHCKHPRSSKQLAELEPLRIPVVFDPAVHNIHCLSDLCRSTAAPVAKQHLDDAEGSVISESD